MRVPDVRPERWQALDRGRQIPPICVKDRHAKYQRTCHLPTSPPRPSPSLGTPSTKRGPRAQNQACQKQDPPAASSLVFWIRLNMDSEGVWPFLLLIVVPRNGPGYLVLAVVSICAETALSCRSDHCIVARTGSIPHPSALLSPMYTTNYCEQ